MINDYAHEDGMNKPVELLSPVENNDVRSRDKIQRLTNVRAIEYLGSVRVGARAGLVRDDRGQ